MNIDGTYQLHKLLSKLYWGIRKQVHHDEVFIPESLSDFFIERHTKFTTAREMFSNKGLSIRSLEEYESTPIKQLDELVTNSSAFESWKELIDAAKLQQQKATRN